MPQLGRTFFAIMGMTMCFIARHGGNMKTLITGATLAMASVALGVILISLPFLVKGDLAETVRYDR
jgi:cyanate permease